MSCYSKALDFDFKWDQGKTFVFDRETFGKFVY